jgi:hypothetical protein
MGRRLINQSDSLKKREYQIKREARNQYLVEHFDTVADPFIKMRWGVLLLYRKAASPEIVQFLRTVLESREQSKVLSARLGPMFDDFVEQVKAYKLKGKT